MQWSVCYTLSLSYLFFVYNETTARKKRQYIISKDDLKRSFNLKAREQKHVCMCACSPEKQTTNEHILLY